MSDKRAASQGSDDNDCEIIDDADGEIIAGQPGRTYRDVLGIVQKTPGLSRGVRQNILSAVTKAAELISGAGLDQVVDVVALFERLGGISAKALGYQTKGSKSAFLSNLRRALSLAGFTVLPGRHTKYQLTGPWLELEGSILNRKLRRALSRFIRTACKNGWRPEDISEAHLKRYFYLLLTTCKRAKAVKVLRATVKAWNACLETIPGWPAQQLNGGFRRDRFYIRPWEDFPDSLRADIEAFVKGEEDWLEHEYEPRKPRTQENYRGALRRAASILVHLGEEAGAIQSLKYIVQPDRAKRVLKFLESHTGRRQGGHIRYMAFLLCFVGHWVRAGAADLERLETFFNNTASKHFGMAEKVKTRLTQFDESGAVDALRQLPADLVASIAKKPVDDCSAKLARVALFLQLLWDTALRSGDVVEIDLDRHVVLKANGGIHIHITGEEIKNDTEFRGDLRPETVQIWKLYIEKYRRVHSGNGSTWLFPRRSGSHWSQSHAYADLKEICDERLGLDVTPHLLRAIIGKVILAQVPGGHRIVQEVLGHKYLTTTVAYYTHTKPEEARRLYHEILERKADGSAGDLL